MKYFGALVVLFLATISHGQKLFDIDRWFYPDPLNYKSPVLLVTTPKPITGFPCKLDTMWVTVNGVSLTAQYKISTWCPLSHGTPVCVTDTAVVDSFVNIKDGRNRFVVHYRDTSGQIDSTIKLIYLNVKPPVLSVEAPPTDKIVKDGTVHIKATCTDSLAWCNIDGFKLPIPTNHLDSIFNLEKMHSFTFLSLDIMARDSFNLTSAVQNFQYVGSTSCPVIGDAFLFDSTLNDSATALRAYTEPDAQGVKQVWIRLPPAPGKKVTDFKTDASSTQPTSQGEVLVYNGSKIYLADSNGIKQELCYGSYQFSKGNWYLTTRNFAYKYDLSGTTTLSKGSLSQPMMSPKSVKSYDWMGRRQR